MKIHTRTVFDIETGEVLEDEFYEYDGPVAHAGGESGGQTSTQSITVPPFQKPFITDVLNQAQNLYQGGPPEYFPGQTVAGVNPTLQAGFDAATGEGVQFATDTANVGGAGLAQLVQGANPLSNPFFEPTLQAMLNPTIRSFQDEVLPAIDSGAVSAGQFGGSRQGVAQGIATDRLGQNLLDTSLQFGNQAYQSGLDSLGRAILTAPAIQQMGLVPSNILTSVGGAERGIEQENINADVDRFNFEEQAPYNALSYYAGLVGNPIGSTAATTAPGGGGGTSLAGAAGGAAAGAAGYMMATGAANAWNPAGWAMMAGGALLGSGLI